jgi:histidinol phosphatase-like enzyme (inositol monophosphatase family)
MTDVTPKDLLGFATEVVWRAGLATLAYFQTDVAIETKADNSPVTRADREAEVIMRELIEQAFPDDCICGEEFGETRRGVRRRWIIDPIDGTRSFVRGVPLYGVMLGIEEDEEMVAGIIHFPALHETLAAARGTGCWWNGRRARVSARSHLSESMIVTTDREEIGRQKRSVEFERVSECAGTVRTWGDCYGYALVATGRAEAMFDPVVSIWDVAALVPIIEEAGGIITDWDGNACWESGHVVATNAVLGPQIRTLLAGGK